MHAELHSSLVEGIAKSRGHMPRPKQYCEWQRKAQLLLVQYTSMCLYMECFLKNVKENFEVRKIFVSCKFQLNVLEPNENLGSLLQLQQLCLSSSTLHLEILHTSICKWSICHEQMQCGWHLPTPNLKENTQVDPLCFPWGRWSKKCLRFTWWRA